MANIKGSLKDASGNVLQPSTDASQVYMQDSNGNDSTIQAEVAALRVTVGQLSGLDGLNIKGEVDGTTNELPASGYKKGDAYLVSVAGTYAAKECEPGDWLICTATSQTPADSDWSVIQGNLVRAVIGPQTSTAGHLISFSNANGTGSQDSGLDTADVATAVNVGATLDSNKVQLAKISEDASGNPTYNGSRIDLVGVPVVESGAAAPTNLLSGGLYFEKAAVAAGTGD